MEQWRTFPLPFDSLAEVDWQKHDDSAGVEEDRGKLDQPLFVRYGSTDMPAALFAWTLPILCIAVREAQASRDWSSRVKRNMTFLSKALSCMTMPCLQGYI